MLKRSYLLTVFPLALLTLLALLIAYAVRPTVHIDLGDYYDSAYLDNFHAREVDAAGPAEEWHWPKGERDLVLPGKRRGDWMITVQAVPGKLLSGAALLVNDHAVGIPRDDEHHFVAFVPADNASDDQLVLRLKPALSGGPEPSPRVVGRVLLEPARTYRWSRGKSNITLPGLGRGAWYITLDLVTAHPNHQPLHAQVIANNTVLATLPDSGTLRRISLLVPSSLMQSGDLALTLRSNTFEDPRPLGMLVADISVSPMQVGGALFPPWGMLVASLTIVLGLYTCLNSLIVPPEKFSARQSQLGQARLLVLVPIVALIGLGAWALMTARFPTSLMLPRFAWLMLWSVGLLLILRPLLRWIFRTACVLVHDNFINLLLLIFFVSYWLKAGGMLYPYFIAIDIHWHMDRVRWILNGGLPQLYGINSPLNESTMPVAEWGNERPIIPYSPYFHMFATLFALFPWSLEFTANMFSALLDSSRLFPIALLALKGGVSQRGALLATLLSAVLPVTFLLHSWGNLPTTFGLWWAFIVTAFVIVAWQRLSQRVPFAILTLLLLASLLFYTVVGLFVALYLLFFTLLVALLHKRIDLGMRPLRWLWLAMGLAIVLSLLIYYGQYISPILERTVPYFAQAMTQSREETGRVSDTLPLYLMRHTRLWDYGLVVPLLLTLIYLVWEWRRAGLLWAAVAAWVGVMLLFFPLAYKISMVDKHFFVAIPLLVIASASVIDRLWARGLLVWLATGLLYSYLALSALSLWLTRIVVVRQG